MSGSARLQLFDRAARNFLVGLALRSGQLRIEGARVEEAEVLGPVDDALGLVRGEGGGEVDQGAGDGGEGEAVEGGEVVCRQPRRDGRGSLAVPWAAARVVTSNFAGEGSRSQTTAALLWLSAARPGPPQASTAAQRQPSARQLRMPDRIDAPMDPHQPARARPGVDRRLAQPRRMQLSHRHHATLREPPPFRPRDRRVCAGSSRLSWFLRTPLETLPPTAATPAESGTSFTLQCRSWLKPRERWR